MGRTHGKTQASNEPLSVCKIRRHRDLVQVGVIAHRQNHPRVGNLLLLRNDVAGSTSLAVLKLRRSLPRAPRGVARACVRACVLVLVLVLRVRRGTPGSVVVVRRPRGAVLSVITHRGGIVEGSWRGRKWAGRPLAWLVFRG